MSNPKGRVPARATRGGRLPRVIGAVVVVSIATGLVVLLMMVLAGAFEPKVGSREASQERSGETQPGQSVEVVLERRPRFESAVGTIRAVHEVVVASKILARVELVSIKAGQEVEQGDLLIKLDEADLEARLEQAEAARTAQEARLEQARVEFERGGRLRERQVIAPEEYDRLSTAFRAARAELERSEQGVKEAKINESYASILAPIAGVIVDKKVNAGDTVTPGQAVATMYNPDRMQMVATVRESLAQKLEVGQELPARLDSLGLECHATISEIVPEAQTESRSFQVKVTGPCPPGVYSGMFGRIFIPLDEEDVLLIPEVAIRRVGQLDQVDVVEAGVTRRRLVQLGRTLGDRREVLSGLRKGERVLVPGGHPSSAPGDPS